jgi:hypothetical protein
MIASLGVINGGAAVSGRPTWAGPEVLPTGAFSWETQDLAFARFFGRSAQNDGRDHFCGDFILGNRRKGFRKNSRLKGIKMGRTWCSPNVQGEHQVRYSTCTCTRQNSSGGFFSQGRWILIMISV